MSREPDRRPEDPSTQPPYSTQTGPDQMPGSGPDYARQEPNPPEQGPTPPEDRRDRRRIQYLALAGLFINGVAVPAILSWLTDPGAMGAFIAFQMILQIVIWAIALPIGLGILRRRGYRSALIYMIAAIFVAGLPFLACMGLLGG